VEDLEYLGEDVGRDRLQEPDVVERRPVGPAPPVQVIDVRQLGGSYLVRSDTTDGSLSAGRAGRL
jgi:hypothetical protein